METPIRGVNADKSVNTCMGVHSGRAKYSVGDGPAEGKVSSQVLF